MDRRETTCFLLDLHILLICNAPANLALAGSAGPSGRMPKVARSHHTFETSLGHRGMPPFWGYRVRPRALRRNVVFASSKSHELVDTRLVTAATLQITSPPK